MIIRLTEEQIRLLIAETKESYPVEACGLLFGDLSSEEAVVRRIVATHNMLESSIDFQVDPEGLLKAILESEKEDMELIGFFHSHPAYPNPSVTDARYMHLWPGNIWLIISSKDYSMEAYQTDDGEPTKIRIEVNRF